MFIFYTQCLPPPCPYLAMLPFSIYLVFHYGTGFYISTKLGATDYISQCDWMRWWKLQAQSTPGSYFPLNKLLVHSHLVNISRYTTLSVNSTKLKVKSPTTLIVFTDGINIINVCTFSPTRAMPMDADSTFMMNSVYRERFPKVMHDLSIGRFILASCIKLQWY